MACFVLFVEALRTELQHKHAVEVEQLNKACHSQLAAARMELERAVEITKQKVSRYYRGLWTREVLGPER